MDFLLDIIKAAAAAGPWIVSLLLTGGMAFIIYTLITKSKDYDTKYDTITGNHLHELPDMAVSLKSIDSNMERMLDTMERQERTLVALDAYVHARLNGHNDGRK